MDRFARVGNAGTKRKLDVTAICRSCGLPDDNKTSILDQISEDDVDFQEKVTTLTGIVIHRKDKMPQEMCETCMDKINDFYEFRLMAQNTEKQTREALGLPLVPQINQLPLARYLGTKEPMVRLVDFKQSAEESLLIERELGKSIKNEIIPSTSKKRAERPTTSAQPPTKKSKKDVSCRICADSHFSYQSDLNDHLIKEHLPLIAKYACGSCRETFEQFSDFKSHESKHSKEKLPYTCFMCLTTFSRFPQYNKHMTNYNCGEKEKLEVQVQDIKCFQCKKKFLTQNLFEWHACFLKTRGSCSKCGQYYAQKKLLFKHYVLCEGRFEAPEASRDPASLVKAENSTKAAVKVSGTASKGPKKKIVPNRKMSTMPNIVKAELNLDDRVEQAEEDDEYANYNEDITYDNFNNDSDSNSALEPVVQLGEDPPAVRVKQERSSDQPAVQQKQISPEIIRNIKKEKASHSSAVVTTTTFTQQQKNIWKLKIKSEKSGGAQPTSQVLNPFAVSARKANPPVQKNVFKMSNEIKMKIKAEKRDAGYGDTVDQRDEAEAEDEDLMAESPVPAVKIKQEKFDPAYGEVRDATKGKQLINPMALMMRDKPLSNGSSENSLVISAVSSINPVTPHENGSNSLTENLAEGSEKAQETPVINDVGTQGKTRTMVQIPREFTDNLENHSSPSTAAPSETNVNVSQKHSEVEADDDLDALLKQYEDTAPPADSAAENNGDIFQDLLEFD